MSSLFSTIFTVMNYNISEIWEIIKFGGPYIATLLALLILVEQITYLKRKWIAPGPTLVLPFVGNAIKLVRNPTKFWDDQADFAKSSHLGISANYIIGRFILFIRSSELSHKIFSNVRPDAFQLVGHPFGKKLFGEHNMIYMYGQEHKDLRRRIAPNFTPRALSTYCQIQQLVIAKHLNKWCEIGSDPVKLRLLARDMNLETSQNVFAGPYLSKEARERFKVDYNFFNVGVLALPIDLPGFAFRNARLAVDRLIETLTCCVEESREKMKRSGFGGESENESDDNEVVGNEPKCLVDYWMQDMIREEREKEKECGGGAYAPAPPPNCSNREIGGHVFDFLFAAQDASTSSLLWAVTLLDAHPDVLERVRVEVESVWELDSPITAEQLACMKYTHAVAREVVRFRAPATLVPHVACEDFPLTTDYVIPKGTIVFPSVYESSFQGFPEPHRFDPDRFYKEDRKEEQLYKRNFLVFGAGAHQCVGQRYALNLLVLFIAMFATLVDFKRHRSEGCDDIAFCPTICPKDDCLVSLSRRKSAKFPPFSLP